MHICFVFISSSIHSSIHPFMTYISQYLFMKLPNSFHFSLCISLPFYCSHFFYPPLSSLSL